MAQLTRRAPIYQQAVRPVCLLWVVQAISRLKPVLRLDCVPPVGLANLDCGTGFSREGVGSHTAELMVFTLASSRLKPVLRIDRVPQWDWQTSTVGPALAGKASAVALQN